MIAALVLRERAAVALVRLGWWVIDIGERLDAFAASNEHVRHYEAADADIEEAPSCETPTEWLARMQGART